MSDALLMGRHCGTCGHTVPVHHVELARRTQRVAADPVTGKPAKVIHVLLAEVLHDFCNRACWDLKEQKIVQVFGLKATWPPFHVNASCCACGRAVDRLAPHVTLNVYDIEDTSKPWFSSARMHEDREFAVLCATCAPPADAATDTAQDEFLRDAAHEGVWAY